MIVHDWPHPFLGRNGRPRAIFTAFEDCCGRHAQDARWIAFLDVDEFLFSPTGAISAGWTLAAYAPAVREVVATQTFADGRTLVIDARAAGVAAAATAIALRAPLVVTIVVAAVVTAAVRGLT